MIQGIPNWVAVPLLILGLVLGAIVYGLARRDRLFRSVRQPGRYKNKRAILHSIEKRR